jgi:hypothetical protein
MCSLYVCDRTIQVFYPKHSKPIIDKIDSVLAEHYKLDEHQKEFIINFDLQFRRRSDDWQLLYKIVTHHCHDHPSSVIFLVDLFSNATITYQIRCYATTIFNHLKYLVILASKACL